MASPREPEVRGALSDDPPRDERGPYGQLARLFLTQLLAVIAIAAVITAVVAATGGGLDDDVTATSDGTQSPANGEPSPTTSPSSTPTSAPAGSGSVPASSPAATTSAPPSTAATTTAEQTPKVDVLNQSAGDGAAGQAADQLRAAGWRIGRVDDFRGNVSTTTVYWLTPDMRRDAQRVARDLGGVRVQEGFSTLVDGRISVVLVD
jgi:hypothetical protein